MKFLLCAGTFLLGMVVINVGAGVVSKPHLDNNNGSNSANSSSNNDGKVAPLRTQSNKTRATDVTVAIYGRTASKNTVHEYTCTNKNGVVMKMITYGAIMTSLEVPDRNGKTANIVLTCPDIQGFEACQSYFGATVGRYCNRIAKGAFSIDGRQYRLETNSDPNHLHGGKVGFDKVVWEAETIKGEDFVGVRFKYESADGEEGYPGKLNVTAEYMLNDDDEVIVDLKATTDQPTHVNLTNHNYWNLAGAGDGKILDHKLRVEADKYLPTDKTFIPTGDIADVNDSLFDFTDFRKMSDRLDEVGEAPNHGFDLCFALRKQDGSVNLAATVSEPSSGRVMEIWTTQPGLQFYTGNFLDGSESSGGYAQYGGFCLETQRYPDTPNQDKFPTTLLKPGETYHEITVHKFRISHE